MPVSALLHDVECKNLIGTTSLFPEPCLLFPQCNINFVITLAKILLVNDKDNGVIPFQLLQLLMAPFFVVLTIPPLHQLSGLHLSL